MDDREKILNALRVIKDTCKGHSCDGCPLRNNEYGCYITTRIPNHWEIRDEPEKWRAFND